MFVLNLNKYATHSQTRVISLHNRITVYLLPLGVFSSLLKVSSTPGKTFINSLVE